MPAAPLQGPPLSLGTVHGSPCLPPSGLPLPSLPHPLPRPLPRPPHMDCCRAGESGRGRALMVIGKQLLRERSIFSLPFLFSRGTQGCINSQLSDSPSSQSSSGGLTPGRLASLSGAQSWATGLSTDHSSLYSWRYDEFDRENTQRVHQLFSDVDEQLYEGRLSCSSLGLQEECKEWNGHSPHLRILGNQLEPPNQEGFEYVPRRAASGRRAVPPQCVEKREEPGELCVQGHGLSPPPCTAQATSHPTHSPPDNSQPDNSPPDCSSSAFFQEEVYEAEGRIEEYLAYDVRDMEDQWRAWGSATQAWGATTDRAGLPPVSPHACLRDAVSDELFDDTWREVVHSLGELLHKHWQRELTDGAAHRGALGTLGGTLGDPPPHMHSKYRSIPLSGGSNTRSMLLWSNCCPTQASQLSSAFKINLNGVMTIQAKPLQQRHQSNYEMEEKPSILTGRAQAAAPRLTEPSFSPSRGGSSPSYRSPASGLGLGTGPGPGLGVGPGAWTPSSRGPTQGGLPRLTASSRPRPSSSSSARARGRARAGGRVGGCLNHSQAVTSHQVIRGTRLTTVTEGQTSPLLSSAHNQRLPLFPPDNLELEPSGPSAVLRYLQPRGRVLPGVTGGSVVPISILPPLREPTLLLESLSRPNTTHTLRSDTPMKRSFTPMDFACHVRTGKGAHPGNRALIGVTGFGVGITCSTSSGFSEGAVVTRRRQHPPSSTEGESGNVSLLLGVPHQRKVFGRFPGHGKKRLQVVMS